MTRRRDRKAGPQLPRPRPTPPEAQLPALPSEPGELTHRQELRVLQSIAVSPIPPPEHLASYQKIQRDIPERLLQQVEKQAEHRQKIETRTLTAHIRLEVMGLCFGFVVVLAVAGVGVWLIATGQAWAGIAVVFSSLAGVASVFLSQTRRRNLGGRGARSFDS